MAGRPEAQILPDGRRLHLRHGPIDLVIEAFGPAAERRAAYARAEARFAGILEPLAAELPLLRRPLAGPAHDARGPVARRMIAACLPHAAVFVTPMAAVAGAVADEMLEALVEGGGLTRAYVNNGGDIALHLAPGEHFAAGVVADIEAPAIDGVATIDAAMPVRGVATSGRGGRSLSLGIADAVTVLAGNAAAADVAATLIANAVDVDHPAVGRATATDLDPDSDLGDRLVTVSLGDLDDDAVAAALDAGEACADAMWRAGLIHGAMLELRRRHRMVGHIPPRLDAPPNRVPDKLPSKGGKQPRCR